MSKPKEPGPNKSHLTEEQYRVTQEKGTETPFTGEFWDHFEEGQYHCVVCGADLFASENKYDAGCGWPSFTEPVGQEQIDNHDDYSHNMHRTEVTCHNCGAHLGHVFPDGPTPKGLRYCINSAALKFEKDKEK